MGIIKGLVAFFQVIFCIIGVTPVSYDIDYGGNDYAAPEVNTPMYIVEDGKTDFVIVYSDDADECIATAVTELQSYIRSYFSRLSFELHHLSF